MVLVGVTLDDKLVDIQAARALVHARGTAELCTSALDLIKATPQNSIECGMTCLTSKRDDLVRTLMDSDDKVRPIVIEEVFGDPGGWSFLQKVWGPGSGL